ncbi:hypothetical protein [Streptomyces sp. URMC 129]|uniref:hypothetical protein n=1 Tax=Streptomyces sp. URMC 129 TaxID=3423407 RepID=UPI003F1BACB7
MARVYATPGDYEAYTGSPAPEGALVLLARATGMLEARVLRLCRYETDGDGMPTHPAVLAAVRDAVCAQVQWWDEIGDSTGAAGAGWGTVALGSARLGRSAGGRSGGDADVSGAASAAREIAPQAWDAFRSPDLTPDLFRLGAVIAC